MKKKGFTLVEVLAVVLLLGLIAMILVPTIRNVIKDSKQKLYDEQINLVENGLKNWANANIFLLPEENETIKLSLGQLKQAGFAEFKTKNPKNNKCFSNESTLKITKYNNSYIYEVDEMIDVNCDLIEDPPIIKLNGSIIEYLNIGDTYVDKGAVAKDSNGVDITSAIITTVSGTSESINTSKEGKNIITYSITDNGKTVTAIRNVIVRNYKNGIMDSPSNCINVGNCANGTLVNVQVNDSKKYGFYVLKDDGKTLTLIMDQNLGNTVAWANEIDYNGTNFGTKGNNSKGPITALSYLNMQTETWTNIDPITNYTYDNNLNGTTYTYGYQKLKIANGEATLIAKDGTTTAIQGISRARMLTSEEATSTEIGCTTTNNSCPKWLYTTLSDGTGRFANGYWTLTAQRVICYAVDIHYNGKINDAFYVLNERYFGVRPVIEISK